MSEAEVAAAVRALLAAHVDESPTAAYVVLVGFADGRVATIRDFRYVPYIAAEATFG